MSTLYTVTNDIEASQINPHTLGMRIILVLCVVGPGTEQNVKQKQDSVS